MRRAPETRDTLNSVAAIQARKKLLLNSRHMVPLVQYAERLRADQDWEVPDFDPVDGGTNASILFLAETPGPMASVDGRGRRKGSGFISLDNDDPTAKTGFDFMVQAGIPRCCIVKWNVVAGGTGPERSRRRS